MEKGPPLLACKKFKENSLGWGLLNKRIPNLRLCFFLSIPVFTVCFYFEKYEVKKNFPFSSNKVKKTLTIFSKQLRNSPENRTPSLPAPEITFCPNGFCQKPPLKNAQSRFFPPKTQIFFFFRNSKKIPLF